MSNKEKFVLIKEHFSAEIKLISTALVLVFAFIAFFNINGSLGWFASSDEVSANGLNVSVRDIKDFSVELKSYSVDSISGADGLTLTEKVRVDPESDDVAYSETNFPKREDAVPGTPTQ